jgi:2-polyprenyl-3-methyl-5-hydroxy-6-metoxy-1,4-benzoquinol methylase
MAQHQKTDIGDKAGEAYWSSVWEDSTLPPAVDPLDKSSGNYTIRRFHALFSGLFAGNDRHGARLLEIGCARSVWLSYFARQFDFDVTGLDYSESGCEQARKLLERDRVPGNIVNADLFVPPEQMLSGFDVVTSFGVAEHFTDTANCISAFSNYLKPGGMMLTVIPNMTWLVGGLQKFMDRTVYDIHVPITVRELRRAHQACGLKVDYCKYFMSTGFGVLNADKLSVTRLSSRLKKTLASNLSRFSKGIALIEDHSMQLPATRFTSPYIVCVARKTDPDERSQNSDTR